MGMVGSNDRLEEGEDGGSAAEQGKSWRRRCSWQRRRQKRLHVELSKGRRASPSRLRHPKEVEEVGRGFGIAVADEKSDARDEARYEEGAGAMVGGGAVDGRLVVVDGRAPSLEGSVVASRSILRSKELLLPLLPLP
jgi:hypothetical protein